MKWRERHTKDTGDTRESYSGSYGHWLAGSHRNELQY